MPATPPTDGTMPPGDAKHPALLVRRLSRFMGQAKTAITTLIADVAAAGADPLRKSNGSAAAPSFSFTSDTDNGLFLTGGNSPAIAAGGVLSQGWTPTGTTVLGTLDVSGAVGTGAISAASLTATGAVKTGAGTKTAPGLGFSSDTDTGLYLAAANNPAMSAGDTKVQAWTTAGTSVTGTLAATGAVSGASMMVDDGTAAAPAVGFTSDTDTGLYRIAANNPALSAGNTKIQDWTTAGTTITGAATITNGLTVSGGVAKVLDGSKTAPALTFSSDTDTGLYRIGANNPAMSAGDTKIQDWTTAGTSVTGSLSASAGVTVTQSTTNGNALTTTGNGTGYGILATGGATASGAVGLGGATSGFGGEFAGVSGGVYGAGRAGSNGPGGNLNGAGTGAGAVGTGGGTSAPGLQGIGGGPNGVGLYGVGTGVGQGAYCISTSGYGIEAVGNATRAPLHVTPRSGAPSTAADGNVYYDSSTNKLRVRAAGAWVDLH